MDILIHLAGEKWKRLRALLKVKIHGPFGSEGSLRDCKDLKEEEKSW